MIRRKSVLDPADFAPLVEVPLSTGVGLLTLPTLHRQFARAAQKVHAAAPALACLEFLEVESSLECSGNGLVLAFWLRPKKQRALWAEGLPTGSELDALIRRDLKTLSMSIHEAQLRFDRLADKLRIQKASAAEERDAARTCGSLLENLTRNEERLVAILRRHGGSHLDIWIPGEGDVRFAFPLYAGGEVRRPNPQRLRARAKDFNRGVVTIFHISVQEQGEWLPLAGIEGGEIALTWNPVEVVDELAPITDAVRDGSYVEFTATLFEDAATRIPRRAELTGSSGLRPVHGREAVSLRVGHRSGMSRHGSRPGSGRVRQGASSRYFRITTASAGRSRCLEASLLGRPFLLGFLLRLRIELFEQILPDVSDVETESEVGRVQFDDRVRSQESGVLIADERPLLCLDFVLGRNEAEDVVESMLAHRHDHRSQFLIAIEDVQDVVQALDLVTRSVRPQHGSVAELVGPGVRHARLLR